MVKNSSEYHLFKFKRMPASDNPYKSLRATIPYVPLNTSDETPSLYPLRICVGADWEMAWGLQDNKPSASQGCHKFHGRYGRNGETYPCDYHDPCWLLSPWLWYAMTFNS